MLSISVQSGDAVRFCCDAEGAAFLLSRMQEVAAGDHAWFAGEELKGGRYEWLSIESRGVRQLSAQEIEHDGKLSLRIECPAAAAAGFCAELQAAGAAEGLWHGTHFAQNLQKFVLPIAGGCGMLGAP